MIFIFLFSFVSIFGEIVIAHKRIFFHEYPDAFNPSIIDYNDGYLLTFRYTPHQKNESISYIGICLLNDEFEPVSSPEILLTRHQNSLTQSQSEDARLFKFRDKIFVIYNDNIDLNNPSIYDRRDMFIAEIFLINDRFVLSSPLKLFCQEKKSQLWEKNWVPFEWNQMLYLSYSINPHEVLYTNLINGSCYSVFNSSKFCMWNYGALRGSSAALLVDGEYLAFFHSSKVMASKASYDHPTWHYFMGAYTFSANPPFEMTRISQEPIVSEGFYEPSLSWKKVVFPGGYVIQGSLIHVAYGKDDSEIWIATIDKTALMESLVSNPVISHTFDLRQSSRD
ncbi:MAG TPA: hypothetical protein VLE96_06460 [Chlamydiales bacterium]|nr:hypothetical protein [Chlamydiales bacterium]